MQGASKSVHHSPYVITSRTKVDQTPLSRKVKESFSTRQLCLCGNYACVQPYLAILITWSRAVVELEVVVHILVVPVFHNRSVTHSDVLEPRDKEVLPNRSKGSGLICTLWVSCKDAHVCIVLSHHC